MESSIPIFFILIVEVDAFLVNEYSLLSPKERINMWHVSKNGNYSFYSIILFCIIYKILG